MTARLDLAATYRAVHEGVVGRVVRRDVVRVTGPAALDYMQGQCTQDLAALAPGASVDALLLSVQGKLGTLVRVTVLGPDDVVVDVEEGWGEAAFQRLRQFKIRVKAELTLATWPVVELRGPASGGAVPGDTGGGVLAVTVSWPGYAGVDLLGAGTLPPDVPEGDDAAFEAARIEAGIPKMGAELTDGLIPQAAGIVGRTVSFTKGCYTGQELVARIDARGNRVPQTLRRLEVVGGPDGEGAGTGAGGEAGPVAASPPTPLAAVGDAVVSDGREVGVLTSVAWSPRTSSAVALGFVRREVEPPAEASVRGAAGDVRVAIAALPS